MNAIQIPPRLFKRAKPIIAIAACIYPRTGYAYKPGAVCALGGYCYSRKGHLEGVHVRNATRGALTPTHGVGDEYRASAPGQIATCSPQPHFHVLASESASVGWPVRFRADLYVHDRAQLHTLDPDKPFLWVLREDGTQLYPISQEPIGRAGSRNEYAWDAPGFTVNASGDGVRFYIWDGVGLRRYADANACAARVREIAESMKGDRR